MKEQKAFYFNGFLGLILELGILFLVAYVSVNSFLESSFQLSDAVVIAVGLIVAGILLTGFTIVQPNDAKVLTFFGRYLGTIKESGFWLTVPLTDRKKVSLKVRNFNTDRLKVNDAVGNPVEIAAVVVFRVVDSAKAVFEVDDYEEFVHIQSETALRHVASKYPYDIMEEDKGDISLRGNGTEVSEEMARELQHRLEVAGVEVMETRLTHLAYSTEIASAMLQRQQALAIVAARKKVVEGAIGMVEDVIQRLEANGFVLDEERKAAMMNNLMVAIVSDRSAVPVINTGSLYT